METESQPMSTNLGGRLKRTALNNKLPAKRILLKKREKFFSTVYDPKISAKTHDNWQRFLQLYFCCRKYNKGCRVILHTEYVEWDDDDLKVISTFGKHNHGAYDQNSSGCGVRRGRKRKYARVVDDDEDSELDEDEGGEGEDGDEGEGEESDDGEDREETEDEEEEKDGTDEGEEITEDEDEKDSPDYDDGKEEEEEAEETVEEEMIRISDGVGIMNYVQFLNWFGEDDLAEKVKFTAPIEFKIIYKIMHFYEECVKGADYMVKDPKLTKQFLISMRSFGKLAGKSYGHKERVQALLDRDFLSVLRGVVGHFVRDPTLIFKAIVKNKYKSDSSVGFEAIYGA